MKKNYMAPSMMAVTIEETMQSTSNVPMGNNPGSGADAMSKRGAFDNYDFEYEEED